MSDIHQRNKDYNSISQKLSKDKVFCSIAAFQTGSYLVKTKVYN